MNNQEMLARLEMYRQQLQEGLKRIPDGELDFDTWYGIEIDGYTFDYNVYDESEGEGEPNWIAVAYCVENLECLTNACIVLDASVLELRQFADHVLEQGELDLGDEENDDE
jgi:hypothetical protein